jgi:hypothetical protein
MPEITVEQADVCGRYGVSPFPAPAALKVGLARNVRVGLLPLNGLRHPPRAGTTGWYFWAGGEPSGADDFFEPVHVSHLLELCPSVVPFLALPPGWRFQIAPGYEDVWRDDTLLDAN